MPSSAQGLYFHLNMRADDDGFIGNPKRICRLIGSNDDDLKLLIAKRFLLAFDDGIVVIKHWRMHNTVQKDRYTPTVYTEELNQLVIKENKSYSMNLNKQFFIKKNNGNKLETNWKQIVSTDIDIDLDKDLDKEKEIDKEKEKALSNQSDEVGLNESIKLVLETGDEYRVGEADIQGWQQLYPDVDVIQQLRNMKGWLEANPNKRKTKKGIKRFINNWLTRTQNDSKNKKEESRTLPDWYKNTKQTKPDEALLQEALRLQREIGG